MAQAKTRRIALWALSILLSIAFLASGGGKLAATVQGENFLAAFHVPAWATPIIGAIEVASAIALLVPRIHFYAAAALSGTMVGAVATHLLNADFAGFLVPLVLGILAGIVAWVTRPVWVQQKMAGGAPA